MRKYGFLMQENQCYLFITATSFFSFHKMRFFPIYISHAFCIFFYFIFNKIYLSSSTQPIDRYKKCQVSLLFPCLLILPFSDLLFPSIVSLTDCHHYYKSTVR